MSSYFGLGDTMTYLKFLKKNIKHNPKQFPYRNTEPLNQNTLH